MKKVELIDLIRGALESIKETDCICNACRVIYNNKLSDPTYTPTKTRKKIRPPCFLSHFNLCDETSFSDTSPPQLNDLFTAFSIPHRFKDSANVGPIINLCKLHYNVLYTFKTVSYCSACDSDIKRYGRHYFCTNIYLERFNHHLNDLLRNVKLNADSILCQTCYFCVYNMKKCENNTLVGVKYMLENVDFNDLTEEETLHTKALVDTSFFVCDLFEKNEAVLAINVFEFYKDKLHRISKVFMNGQYSSAQPKKVKWLLSGLSSYFGHLLIVEKNEATNHSHLLLCKHCNLRKALHKSLFQLRVSIKGDYKGDKKRLNLVIITQKL